MTSEINPFNERSIERNRIWGEVLKIPHFAELDEERWEELLKELRRIIFCVKY